MFGNILAITYIAKEINKYQSPKLTQNQNFHITRQLITLNAASHCDSLGYSGDSFQNTRHPLITLKPCILLRM